MEDEIDFGPIMYLPNEIIAIILQNLKCRDIINFGSTCKKFNEFINSNQYIWKEKFKEILPNKISDVVAKYGNGNWLNEMKRFYYVRQRVYEELMAMSPKYYWRTSDVTLEDVRNFFDLALSHNLNYHYVIYTLQDVVRRGNQCMDNNSEKPFTMTDVYYAKIVVRYITQSFLTVKWMQSHIKDTLTPEVVLNFFVQWTDPVNMHSDEIVTACYKSSSLDAISILKSRSSRNKHNLFIWQYLPYGLLDISTGLHRHRTCLQVLLNLGANQSECQTIHKINTLIEKVEHMFPTDDLTKGKVCTKIKNKIEKGILNEKQVMQAISDVIYRQHYITIMAGTNLEGLDIVKVFSNNCGNLIVAAVLYQAVAKGCGVRCELIAFPNHLFLEWHSHMQAYIVDLETGNLVPQGRCPFAPRSTYRKEYKYTPDGLIQYIISAFLMTMGAIKNWYTQNAVFLLDYLSNNIDEDNPYRDFLSYMVNCCSGMDLHIPIELEYLQNGHMKILDKLANLNKHPTHFAREDVAKHHDPSVTFAVGMLAYHKKYDYLCVVRGWDLNCTTDWRRRVEFKDLELGPRQPFYSVISVDQSERYVAQENLIHVDRPNRLYHLEDVIAKEFTHFDGFCYVPNREKRDEYPEDDPIRLMYRSRAEQRAAELREAL